MHEDNDAISQIRKSHRSAASRDRPGKKDGFIQEVMLLKAPPGMDLRNHRAYNRLDDSNSDYNGADLADRDPWSNPTSLHIPPKSDTKQTKYSSTSFETGHEQYYDSKEQTRKLLRKQFIRWLGTAFFAAFIAVTFKIYASKGVITSNQKSTFNAIITALSLGLGLNFFEAFKGLARLLRWRFLAEEHHSVRKVDLILGIDNLTTVVKLAWESSKTSALFVFCVLWILLNLSAQISVALINLTYSIDAGTDWNGTYTRPGTVNVTDLSCFHGAGGCPGRDHEDIQQSAAHLLGEFVTGGTCGPYNTTADILNSKYDYDFYCRRNPGNQEFAYRFSEYNPKDKQRSFPWFTNRIITASSGPCFEYAYVNRTLGLSLGGIRSAWNYTFTNGSYSGNILIPADMESLNGTTYVYRGINIPQEATAWHYGPRGMWMWGHKSGGAGSNSTFYQCPISISSVSNVTNSSQNLSDGMARLAASAIALQGRFVVNSKDPDKRLYTQYQFYPFGSHWETHYYGADRVGANMAEFAIGSIANLAKKSIQIQMQGTVPYLGSRIGVSWDIAIPLLVGIAGVHFLLFVSVVYASRVVVILDDSNLSAARLLHSLINLLGPSGTFLDGKQISQALTSSTAGGLVYGPKNDEASQGYHLRLGKDIVPRINLPNRRHPDGKIL